MEVMLNENDGQIIPAMPEDPMKFRKKFIKEFSKACLENANMSRHSDSLLVRMDVRNVPLKPAPEKLHTARHKASLTDGHDNLNTMLPDTLFKINIGSNVGLGAILRKHYEDEKQHTDECKRYTAFNMDCDIFDRTVKVWQLLDSCVWARVVNINRTSLEFALAE